ncbi:MAG: glycosyltransferase [Anaerolineales bacterium]
MMIAGLQLNGVDVIECHETLWHGIEDRVSTTTGGWFRPSFWARLFRTYLNLLRKYSQIGDYDILIIGYPGQFDVFLARLLSWIHRKPLVWDVFMSIYLISIERGLDKRSYITVKILKAVEWIGLRLPNLLIQDTSEYVSWFEREYRLKPNRFQLVPTGADDRIFKPLPLKRQYENIFRVIYYGTFIPNHGVKFIIDAAMQLKDQPGILFELVGSGPELANARQQAQANSLSNIEFIDWLDKPALIKRVANADVCLGAFGETPQSLMTIQNKIYEGLAMRRPVLTGDSDAIRQEFDHGVHLFLCDRANGSALASSILTLKNDPELCARLSFNGYNRYWDRFDLMHNGRRYYHHLYDLAKKVE